MATLTPVQSEILERLRPPRDRRPEWPAETRVEILRWLEESLDPLVTAVEPGDPLFISKRALSGIHGCETRFLADRDQPFEWTVPMARGRLLHKAIELDVHRRERAHEADLVEESLAWLVEGDDSLGDWLRGAGATARTELAGEATSQISAFLEGFPPVARAWRPVTESPRRIELCAERVVLSGRLDLTLGAPDGTTASRVIVDLKSGGYSPEHREDLRFYALLELLKNGVPPLSVATFYLDSARLELEAVSEASIEAAVRRTIDGAERLVRLSEGAEPTLRPGPACRWCPINDDCATGRGWLEEEAETPWAR